MNTNSDRLEELSDALINLGAVKQQVLSIVGDVRDVEPLLSRIKRLKNNAMLSRSGLIKDFVTKWEGSLANRDFRLSQEEADSMARSCDELRFRMLSSALGAWPQGFFADAGNSNRPASNTIVHGRSGICHATFGSYVIILMPDFREQALYDLAAADLETVYDGLQGRRSNWVIDFSSVEHAPSILFMAHLVALKGALTKTGSVLALVWLRDRLFAPAFLKQLKAAFDLQFKGGHFFSRAAAEVWEKTEARPFPAA